MDKFCCAFGHSDCFTTDTQNLIILLQDLISNHNVTNFLLSDFGNFDRIFFGCVNSLKKQNSNIKLILVKPYYTKELSKNKEFYLTNFDEIIIPDVSANAHYKSSITLRNKWMIDKSEFVISNIYKNYGGAFDAIKYAKKADKKILYL